MEVVKPLTVSANAMDDKTQKEIDEERIQKIIRELSEHFDTVRVFVTRNDFDRTGDTLHMTLGAGNYFTQSAQIREWLMRMDERVRWRERKRLEENDDGNG